MFLHIMKSKIHRATVTEADLNYIGSITIDSYLMSMANILENEKVQVVNNNNGNRLETYVIPGTAKSGIICLNGAAARLVQPGDRIIIISYAILDEKEAKCFKPKVIFLNDDNNVVNSLDKEEHGEAY